MIVYFGAAIIATLFARFYEKSKSKMYIVISFLALFLVSAFRYGIGYDYLNIYVPIFNNIANGIDVSWDIGTILLCKIILIFSKDYIYFFIITSFIIIYYMYKGIFNASDIPSLSIFLFVATGAYMSSLNVLRQYMALAIFVYALKYILNRNLKKYIFYIIIAGFLHYSAFLLLPFYFISRLKLNPAKQLLIIILAVIIAPIASKLFMYILAFTSYAKYINNIFNTYDPTYSELFLSVILYLTSFWFYKREKNNEKFRLFFNLTFTYLVVALLSFNIILAYRLIIYFKIIQIFMIPYLSKSIKREKYRIGFILGWIFIYLAVTLFGTYYLNWYATEYVSIFQVR